MLRALLFVTSITLLIIQTTFAPKAFSQSALKLVKLSPAAYPPEILKEKQAPAPSNDGLPDGLIATHPTGDIREAWYSGPTTRYRHAILGDGVEAGVLKVKNKRGATLSVRLPRNEVFEDRTPRLVDLDDDGKVEVVTIRSSVAKGAGVTIYGLDNGFLVKKASTSFIGRANRWLNIAGIAPYAGVRGKEIAYVLTPHIGGTLMMIKYHKGKLVPFARAKGFSNHVIGSTEMRLSASVDVTGDRKLDLAVPSANRKSLKIISITKSGPKVVQTIALPAAINKAIAPITTNQSTGFVVGLENGEVYQISK
ncbi:MAG: hypothetical protein AB8B49_03865 [Nitratireductor sp.]